MPSLSKLNRREVLAVAANSFIATAAAPHLRAEGASQLPFKSSGLEHVGFTVPDPEKSSAFYGRIFDPQTFQERDPPPRYYARLGTGYAAFGKGTPARIDHICVLIEDYRFDDMKKELDSVGIKLNGQPAFGLLTDPDGLRLQLIGTPAGLAKTIIPATRVTQDDAAIQPAGLDHIMLAVTDLEKSTAFYRRLLGQETRAKNPDRAWFSIARTKLGLQAGSKPQVDHFSVRVTGFNRGVVAEKLKKLSAEIVASSSDEKLLRIRDSDGIVFEMRGVS
jgi:catechol 2,3-dioxygenase-like lactoylglutathione lyase family enzyme